jgi:hypothetical protein
MTPAFANLPVLLGARGAALAANLLWLSAAAGLYAPKEAALVAMASLAGSALEALKGLGLGSLLLRELGALEGGEAAGRIRTYLAWTAATVLPGAAAVWWLGPRLRPEVAWDGGLWGRAVFLTLAQSLSAAFLLVLQARGRFRAQALWTAGTSGVQRALPAAAAAAGGLTFESFLNLTAVLSAATLLPMAREAFRWMAGGRMEKFREFWPRSRHFYGGSLLRFTATQLDQVAAAALVRADVLTAYLLLRRFYSLAIVFLEACFDSLIPELSRRAKESAAAAGRLHEEMKETLCLAAVPAGIALAANSRLADPVLTPLFGAGVFAFVLYTSALVRENIVGDPARALRYVAATAAANLFLLTALGAWAGGYAPAGAMTGSLLFGALISQPIEGRMIERLAAIGFAGLAAHQLPFPCANAVVAVWLLREWRHPVIRRLMGRVRARLVQARGAA